MVCSFSLVFVTKMASSPRSHPILSSCIERTGSLDEHTWVGLLVRIYWGQVYLDRVSRIGHICHALNWHAWVGYACVEDWFGYICVLYLE